MEAGIFAKTFVRPDVNEVLKVARGLGYTTVQFNMACAGLPSMPDEADRSVFETIKAAAKENKLSIAALSGTFNMIHPDVKVREKGLRSIGILIRNAKVLGTNVVSICTGSRDEKDMWQEHPRNNDPDAWRDLCVTLEKTLKIAEEEQVFIAFEPELGNVINSTKKGRQLLTDMRSQNLKVIFDPANLFEKASQKEIQRLIAEGLDNLGEHVVLAHAKDRKADGSFAAAGTGIIPFGYFISELKKNGFDGALVAHGLEESQAATCYEFLKKHLNEL